MHEQEGHGMVGKTIMAVYLANDQKAIRFDTQEGDEIVAKADGDCCSSTWIEHVEGVGALIGAKVLAVEDIEMPDLGSPDDYDVVAYYGCKITTDKGHCILDYRNSSNGYYGGNLSWAAEGYFYGGVYGQNVSSMVWEALQ